ncbi:MAG: putative signal transducing protein [Bacteroidia bacterium]
MKRIASFTDSLWAYLLRDYLESEGVPTFLKNLHAQGIFGGGIGIYNPAMGPIELYVHEKDYEKAQELLQSFFQS